MGRRKNSRWHALVQLVPFCFETIRDVFLNGHSNIPGVFVGGT